MKLLGLFVLIYVASTMANNCLGQIGGTCLNRNSTCCGLSGCCAGPDAVCCVDGSKSWCSLQSCPQSTVTVYPFEFDPYDVTNILSANKISIIDDHAVQIQNKMARKSNYRTNKLGVLYSDTVTKAVLENNQWQIGDTVHSSELKVGDKIWWPNGMANHVLLQVEYHNVTATRNNCCWSVSVGFPEICKVKYCCGTGCCC